MTTEPHHQSSTSQSPANWTNVVDTLTQATRRKQLAIVVPTLNAEAFLDITLSYYRQLGIPVTVVVDGKSTDRTEQIARQLADTVVVLDNEHKVVEGMIQTLSTQTGAAWVLRLDDDELPTKAMLAYVARIIQDPNIHAAGFARHQCAVSKRQTLKASRIHRASDHRQWRLYRPAFMTWTQTLHTAGFEPVAHHSHVVPESAFMVHLDWSLHDYASRAAIVQHYDTLAAGKGSMWRSFYLYEDDPAHGPAQFVMLELPEFAEVCAQIAQRFPQNCIDEPGLWARLRAWRPC